MISISHDQSIALAEIDRQANIKIESTPLVSKDRDDKVKIIDDAEAKDKYLLNSGRGDEECHEAAVILDLMVQQQKDTD